MERNLKDRDFYLVFVLQQEKHIGTENTYKSFHMTVI